MNDKTNWLITTLRAWFEPIVEKSSKQLHWVADSLASVVTVLLIALSGALLSATLDRLAAGVILTPLAAFI